MLEQSSVIDEPGLDGVVADEVVERVRRLDELDEPSGLALDQPLFQTLERLAVKLLARMTGTGQQPLDVDEVQPGSQLGQLPGSEIGQVSQLVILTVVPGDEVFA